MNRFILKQIWNERLPNTWLWIELLLVSIVLWIIIDWGYVQIRTYLQPRGFDIENVYLLRFSALTEKSNLFIPAEKKTTTIGQDMLALMERIRQRPDVDYVSYSINSYPYNISQSSYNMVHDTLLIEALERPVTADFFNVFRYQNVDGSGSQSLAEALKYNTTVVSSNFMEGDYRQNGLLGMDFYINYDTASVYTVEALSIPVRYNDFSPAWNDKYYAKPVTESQIAGDNSTNINWYEICVRTNNNASPTFASDLIKESQRNYMVGNCYIKSVQPFSQIKKEYHKNDYKNIKTRGFIVFFLLVNIFLGIIGTFWFRTQQRRSEMALHLALGSSQTAIHRLLITEAIWILLFAFVPAMIICFNIGYADLAQIWQMKWGMARFLPAMFITFLLMFVMIIAGIWYPAYQARKTKPAEALRDE